MRPQMKHLILKYGQYFGTTRWDRVAHIVDLDNYSLCGFPVERRINKADLVAGVYPLCNGCHHAQNNS